MEAGDGGGGGDGGATVVMVGRRWWWWARAVVRMGEQQAVSSCTRTETTSWRPGRALC